MASAEERQPTEANPRRISRQNGTPHAQGKSSPVERSTNGVRNEQQNLSEEERREIEELKRRDREVRAHEQAHLAAAGGYAKGGARYTYKVGPDGKRYAVGGEVPIDVSEVPGNPQATLQKAMTVRRAALAPSNPSAADRSIAARASMMAAKARQEMAREAKPNGSAEDATPVSEGKASEFVSAMPSNATTKAYPDSSARLRSRMRAYARDNEIAVGNRVELLA
ncbi:MAG: putative metalloprotease CJM1_0395 family protein [candidate division KSB1 bacterium]|nr:putative metalloprotease CJM1_0395 family protein [candidate division KSB1 bacterium]